MVPHLLLGQTSEAGRSANGHLDVILIHLRVTQRQQSRADTVVQIECLVEAVLEERLRMVVLSKCSSFTSKVGALEIFYAKGKRNLHDYRWIRFEE